MLANRRFPVGYLEVITTNLERLENYFGFVSRKVLPPEQLYLPVLPLSLDGKLLCCTCAKDQYQGSCPHRDEHGNFTCTYTTWELMKASEKGYRIQEIYEVLHYPQHCSELFKGYIITWLKIKT